jgi:hypothetical protein
MLYGNEQGDWPVGNAGDDILEGDEDGDWLAGGSGSDAFVIVMTGFYTPSSENCSRS